MPDRRDLVVRYRVRPEHGAENEALVRAVFAELERAAPAGLRYVAFRLDDGLSFVHLVRLETADGLSPLPSLSAFQRFQAGIRDRCDEQPVVSGLTEIGAYDGPVAETVPTRD